MILRFWAVWFQNGVPQTQQDTLLGIQAVDSNNRNRVFVRALLGTFTALLGSMCL